MLLHILKQRQPNNIFILVGHLISGINDFKKAKESNYSFPTSNITLHKSLPEIQDNILRNSFANKKVKAKQDAVMFQLWDIESAQTQVTMKLKHITKVNRVEEFCHQMIIEQSFYALSKAQNSDFTTTYDMWHVVEPRRSSTYT